MAIPVLLGWIVALAGCYKPGMDESWRDGRYALISIDTESQMGLCWVSSDGSYIDVVDATVFAVGSNARFIVVKRHPSLDLSATKYDRSVTEYFIVKRVPTLDTNDPTAGVEGPLSEVQFRDSVSRLSLPAFSKVFDNLK
ncbi:MAG: hypothetical protein M3R59_04520 [Verrucomicrobiota bacterium]|nr:hypothetical protein [Verrucomicrobiota bacterium]MDQ2949907.1 hypothetical protein [Acidobacteriota bacterium]